VETDAASRITIDTEWELANAHFEEIVEVFEKPSVDLFASRINKKM